MSLAVLYIYWVPPNDSLHLQTLRWAARLEHSKAYDAQYMALAEGLGATLWTADERLANAARQIGVTWVHWVEES